MTFSDLFNVTIIQRQITRTRYNIELYLQWPTNKKSYMIYRTAPFSMTLNDPYPEFQGHAVFWCWISQKHTHTHTHTNGTTYRHSSNEILIGANTRPTQRCHFEWPWVTTKYLMTRSVARSLCDSWAYCSIGHCLSVCLSVCLWVWHQTFSNCYSYSFYRATHMHSAVYAVARCPSVRLLHAGILCLNCYTFPQKFSPSGRSTILVFPHQTGCQ